MSAQRVVLATAASYVQIAVRLGCGLLTFRWLFTNFDARTFGFYVLMWSTLGFLVLADFGFGVAAQRIAAARKDADDAVTRAERQALLSAIVWFGIAIAAGLLVVALAGVALGRAWDLIAPDFVTAIVIFAVGAVAIYATGVFREILRGRHLNWIIHTADAIGAIATTIGIWLALQAGFGLVPVVAISVGVLVMVNLALVAVALREPAWRLVAPRSCWRRLREITAFSLYSYGVTVAGVVARLDHVVLGSVLGLPSVAIYAVGSRLMQMSEQMTGQVEAALGPLVPRADAQQEGTQRQAELRRLFCASQRWSIAIALPVLTVLAWDLEVVIQVLTGVTAVDATMTAIAAALLAALLVAKLTSSTGRWVLLMSGGHRRLLQVAVAEAVVRIGLGAGLAWWWQSPFGMAIGYLIAAGLIHGVVVMPLMHRHLEMTGSDWWQGIWRSTLGVALASGVGLGVWLLLPLPAGIIHLLIGSAIMLACVLPAWWMWSLEPAHRLVVQQWWAQRSRRRS